MNGTGKFIVFEGIDGSGKSTQIRLLSERLEAEGVKVALTAEPTSSVTGGLLRDALVGQPKRTPEELAAMFVLDRINHNVNPVNGIEKLLSEGYFVICDRYYYSSLAYQGAETSYEWVRSMNLSCPAIRRPDLCVFLDLDTDTALERINRARAVTEIYEEKSKLEKIRKSYLDVLASLEDRETIRIFNAAADRNALADEVWQTVKGLV